jgi:hypothetical protein
MPVARYVPFVLLACALPCAAQDAQVAEPADAACLCRFFWERDLQTIRWVPPDARRSVPVATDGVGTGACACDLFNARYGEDTFVCFDGVVRGYYLNDQRIQWSGVEEVFGAEAILRPAIYYQREGWTVSGEAELFINQPFGPSILRDAQRLPFLSNFDVDTFQVFQLYAQVNYEDYYLRVGKSRTPFGAYSSPMFTNRLIDAPFIRSEVIAWTETGAFFHYEPGLFSLDLAVTNGEPDLDTNSSKALIGRVGLQDDWWGVGFSAKWHDGISSESQKRYNNHAGVDAHVCLGGRWVIYGEGIYDEYGFHRNFFRDGSRDPAALGPRSIYVREVFKADKSPVVGWGYYVAAGYRGDRVLADVSYGSYFPEKLGILGHDDDIHRAVLKLAYSVTTHLQVYAVGIVENDRETFEPLSRSNPWAVIAGMQFVF